MAMVRREYCAVVFIDLKNAYDCVNLDKLVTVPIGLELLYKLIKILLNLLRNNTVSINLANDSKTTRSKSNGLIQGGILSPTLFYT